MVVGQEAPPLLLRFRLAGAAARDFEGMLAFRPLAFHVELLDLRPLWRGCGFLRLLRLLRRGLRGYLDLLQLVDLPRDPRRFGGFLTCLGRVALLSYRIVVHQYSSLLLCLRPAPPSRRRREGRRREG